MKNKAANHAALTDQHSFFVFIPALVWQFCLCIFPLLFIVIRSFVSFQSENFFTFLHYKKVFTVMHMKIVFSSLMIASMTSVFCLLLGFPLAYWLARYAGRLKSIFLFFLIIPFWTNLLILLYSWLFILERHGLLDSLLKKIGIIDTSLSLLYTLPAVLLVMIYCYVPFMVLPIFTALERIDGNLLEASSDLGATYWQTLSHLIIPLSWPGIRTGMFLVFVPVFGEFAIPLIIGGGKYMFVGNAIVHYILAAFDFSLGAAFTIVASVMLLIFLLVFLRCLKSLLYRGC